MIEWLKAKILDWRAPGSIPEIIHFLTNGLGQATSTRVSLLPKLVF